MSNEMGEQQMDVKIATSMDEYTLKAPGYKLVKDT